MSKATLVIVGAVLLLACCSDDGKPAGDNGVTVPDGGTGDGTTDGQTGVTCSEIMTCVAGCADGDTVCQNDCVAEGTPGAENTFKKLLTCMNDARTGDCSGECTDPDSSTCVQCVGVSCATELSDCKADAPITGSNSGILCTVTNQTCPDPGEACVFLEQGATTGMCLGRCANQGDSCEVKDSSTQLSECRIEIQGSIELYCGWYCEVGGQTYSCPNTTDYDCKPYSPITPNTKYCMPK